MIATHTPLIQQEPHHFPTGARPSPRHVLCGATSFRPRVAPPPQVAYVPSKLDYWGNNSFGDCHDEQTEVLTEHGWRQWADYDGSALLATINPATQLLEFQAPTNVIRRPHDGPMAYGIRQGQDFAITPNHRLFLRPYKIAKNGREYIPGASGYGEFEFRTVAHAPSRFLMAGAPSGFLGTRLDKLTIGSRKWDGTDFLRLLALVISDGYASSGSTHPERSSFCCFREDRLDMVRSFAHKLGIREEKSRPGVWVMEDVHLAEWLRTNIYASHEKRSPFKRIPDLVKVASQDQIEEFLRFYGDQSFSNGRDFYTSSRWIASDLQELLLRTGKRANIAERDPRSGGINAGGQRIEGRHPSFQLHVWEDSDVAMLGPRCKQASLAYEHYKGEVFCATVPNSTLITRRNGSVLISGNCVSAEEAFAKACYGLDGQGGGKENEIFIDSSTVVGWARQNGYLNGADLSSVMDSMAKGGFQVASQRYDDGPYAAVDYSNEATLQAALALGPVKIAIASSALPSGAGSKQGWYVTGNQGGRNTDHSVSLAGYGPAQFLFDQLGVSLPSSITANQPGYLLFTWSTIGFIDHAWLMGTCAEAWIRNPTTVGVPPLPPIVPPVPPSPTLSLPGPIDMGLYAIEGQSGPVATVWIPNALPAGSYSLNVPKPPSPRVTP